MNDKFEMRIHAAAVAGWWTLLIAAAFLTFQWLAYLFLMHAKPDWVLSLMGPGLDWGTLERVWFWIIAAFKSCLWFLALPVIWLTLWSRRLRRSVN